MTLKLPPGSHAWASPSAWLVVENDAKLTFPIHNTLQNKLKINMQTRCKSNNRYAQQHVAKQTNIYYAQHVAKLTNISCAQQNNKTQHNNKTQDKSKKKKHNNTQLLARCPLSLNAHPRNRRPQPRSDGGRVLRLH